MKDLFIFLQKLNDIWPAFGPPGLCQHWVDDDESVLMTAEPVVGEDRVRFLGVESVLKDVHSDAVMP
jgi:hypothetical protein